MYDEKIKLSANFKLGEFTKSATAKALGIDNLGCVDAQVFTSLQALCENVLQPLRDMVLFPIVVTSGFRCPKLNKAVGGAKNSQHMKGEAADIRCNYLPAFQLASILTLNDVDFDQLILEERKGKPSWLHVSYVTHRKNRNQKLHTTDGKKYSYLYI